MAVKAKDPQLQALLANVGAGPEDMFARHVLADLLEERGDPRGEYLRLQLCIAANQFSGAMRHRADELWRRHSAAWFAELEPLLQSVEFSAGFPIEGTLNDIPLERLKAALTLPTFVTLARLHGPFALVLEALAAPQMRALSLAQLESVFELEALLRRAVPERITDLRVSRELGHGGLEHLLSAVLTAPAFSRLARLELQSDGRRSSWPKLLAAVERLDGHPNLRRLTLHAPNLSALDLSGLWRRLHLERLELCAPSTQGLAEARWVCERGPDGMTMQIQGVSLDQMYLLRQIVPLGTTHVALMPTRGDDSHVTPEELLLAYAGLSPTLA